MVRKKPWAIQKELQLKEVPTQDDLVRIVKDIPNLKVQALVILEYLTGGRISELVGRNEYYKYSPKKIEGFKEVSHYKGAKGERYKYKYVTNDKGIQRNHLEVKVLKDIEILEIRISNRKHKTKFRKTLPIPVSKELPLLNILKDYLNTLNGEEPLFKFGRIQAYKLIMKHTGFNNHYFRHIRATHLIMVYGFNEHQLVRFMGWTDSRPAKNYIELRIDDLLY